MAGFTSRHSCFPEIYIQKLCTYTYLDYIHIKIQYNKLIIYILYAMHSFNTFFMYLSIDFLTVIVYTLFIIT